MIETITKVTRGKEEDTNGDSTAEIPAPVTTTRGRGDGESTGDHSTECDEEPVPVHLDQVFGVLKNQRRRSVLRYMQSVDEEVRLGELSEQIAAWECDKPVARITSGERKRVYVGLYQSHLPKMDDVDAIEYNKQRGKIKPGQNMATFSHYLPADEEASPDRQWLDDYRTLVLAAINIVLVLVLIVALS